MPQGQQTIPVVSLQDFIKGTPEKRQQFIQTVGRALEEIGFFALEGHGIDKGLIDKAYGVAFKFFELPESVKQKYENVANGGQRGYTSFGREHAKDSKAPDLKEFWHEGQDLPSGHPLNQVYPQNVYPSEVSEFKQTVQQLFASLDKTAAEILKACALYLGEPENLFAEMANLGNSILRIIHYPPIPENRDPSSVRSAAHEDINLITLLCEATDDGLELQKRDGTWLAVKAVPGQIVVDAGDMLQNITNGVLKSTTHRVVNPDNSRSRRFSMPFFMHARSEVSLNPLPSMVACKGGVKNFRDITAGQYLQERLKEIGLKS